MAGELRRRVWAQQSAPLVDQHRHAGARPELRELPGLDRGDEADLPEVAGKDLEQERRLRADRRLVIREARAVGRSHLHQAGAGGGHDLRDAERAADLHQLAARHHHLSPLRQRRQRDHQRRRVVVDHQGRLGAGERRQQPLGAAVALPAAAGVEVDLQVAIGVEERREAPRHGCRQRRAAEVGVEEDAGGVEHPPQRVAEQRLDALGDAAGKTAQGALELVAAGEGIGGEPAPQIVDFALGLDPYGTSPV